MIEAEVISEVMYEGSAYPISASRQANGTWHVTFRAQVRVLLGDRREVWVTREFRVRATDYKGHKPGRKITRHATAAQAGAQEPKP